MKKLSYFLAIGVIAAGVVLYGCKKKEDPAPVEDCASKTYPTTSGTATVSILNYGSSINVAAGDVLSFAVQITKGTNRPQKLRIYESDCANDLGTIVSIAGQPGAEDGGTRLDLQNTDNAQIRQFVYTVPTGMSTIYLSIEIDESGSTYTYKKVTLNVSGSGIIDSWSGVTLGAQLNASASRMSSGTGQTYAACDAYANIDYIDVTYAWNTDGYLCSNPARFAAPVGLTTSTVNCGEDGTALPTNGGNATYFKVYSGGDFATITDAGLAATGVTTSDNQYINFTASGGVYAFLNSKGKYGLIKVNSYTSGTNGSVSVDVKVQR